MWSWIISGNDNQLIDKKCHPVLNLNSILMFLLIVVCADMSSNSGWLSRDLSFETSPTFLRNQMELLRSFSECALQTSRGFSVSIPEDHSSSLIPGNRGILILYCDF